jgi:hypothetical protein
MKQTTQEPTLLDAAPAGAPINHQAAVQPEPTGSIALVIERVAANPRVSVDKLERIMAMQERILAHEGRMAFDAAMSAAQADMRRVVADATNPQTHSRYASYGALDRALRPVYTKHGFGLSFNTGDAPLPDYVRVLCEVTHRGGFSKPYHIDMPADGKGAKGGDVMTKTHAVGSAASYGMRYLLKMIFNVAVGDDDDDGNKAAQKTTVVVPDEPAGFTSWADDMTAAAQEGAAAFNPAWNQSKPEFTKYALTHRRALTEGWKATVAKIGRARKAAEQEAPRG